MTGLDRRRAIGFAASALLGATVLAAEPRTVGVGTLLDGPSLELESRLAEYRGEILALTEGEFDLRFEPRHQEIADWTASGVDRAARRLLADPDVDVVLALGVLASQAFCCRGDLPKPVLAPVVIDAGLQGFPVVDGRSGARNLNFLAMPRVLERDLATLARLVPVERLVLLTEAAFADLNPEIQAGIVGRFAAAGIDAEFRQVSDSIAEAVTAIPDGTDAVYVLPLHRFSLAERRDLFAALARRGLPSFSWIGREEVELGALVGLGAADYHHRMSRRVALHVQRVLLGQPPESLPIRFELHSRLVMNLDTAREIGLSPPWEALLEAEWIGSWRGAPAERLTLDGAIERAIEANLDLEARRLGVAAGAVQSERARSALLPQVELGAQGIGIDEDRASSPFSPRAERSLEASLTVRQALWAEPLYANLAIQRSAQEARESALDQLRLDIGQQAAAAYLGLLRARTVERIRRENLALSRSHLELARVRLEIGSAIEAEVVRWESRIASDLEALVDARAQRELASIALSRVLHRPLEAPLDVAEDDLLAPGVAEAERRLLELATTPRRLERLREHLVVDGLSRAPELIGLDHLLAAKRRELASARRAFWSPTLGLAFELERRLDEAGAGSGGRLLVPGLDLPTVDETDRTVALGLSLPLFEGGDRGRRVDQVESELDELELERRAAGERIEQRIRSALIASHASFHGIRLSRDAATAAARNLELVRDAYARGSLSILDLLDAQSAALVADLAASDAVHQFFLDRVEVERAIGRLGEAGTAESRAAWLDELQRSVAADERSAQEGMR